MRGVRSTIALLAVLAGLVAYIYFVTWKTPDGAATPPKERVFASLEADSITEITVTSESGETTTVRKDNGHWQVTAPVTARADEMEVSAITSNLSTLEVSRVVDENPAGLEEYGLASPRVQVEFAKKGDTNARRLLLGEKSPTGGDVFARRDNEKRVFLIPGFTESFFNRTSFDLRDKTLLTFDRDTVDGIELSSAGHTLQFAKQGADWQIVKPVSRPADAGAVEGLVGRVQTAAMTSIVTENAAAADVRKYGLDRPQGTLHIATGSARATLLIGQKLDDGGNAYYARDASRMAVVTVDGSLLDELKKTADDYRKKALFDFRAYNTDRLEFVRDGQTIVFDKVKGADNKPDTWRRVSPAPGEPSQTNMESLIAKLENLRASAFLDSAATTGLDKPSLTVFAKFDDGKKEERVSFVKTGSDVYSARAGETGAVKVSTTEFDDTVTALGLVAK